MQLILILFTALICSPDETVLTTSSGRQIVGELAAFNENDLLFRQKSQNEPETVGFDQIASIKFVPDPVAPVDDKELCKVQLIDDSTLLATSFQINGGVCTIILANGVLLETDNRNLASVLFKIPVDAQLLDQWDQLKKSPLDAGDALIIDRNGRLDSLEGVIGEITAEKVGFKMDDQSANIGREKIDGIIFYHASGRKLPKPVCQVTLNDRSTLMVRELKYGGEVLNGKVVSGSEYSVPKKFIATMDFSLSRAVWLGEMQPTSRSWTPLIASSAILDKLRSLKLPRANRGFDNRKLELQIRARDGLRGELRSFETGYAMVGGSKIAFSLGAKYERLTGLVGFAPKSGVGGDLKVIIRGDDKILLEMRMEKRSLQSPIEIDLNIKDCDRLVIEVEYYDGRSIGDLIHLCDLKASR